MFQTGLQESKYRPARDRLYHLHWVVLLCDLSRHVHQNVETALGPTANLNSHFLNPKPLNPKSNHLNLPQYVELGLFGSFLHSEVARC